MSLLSEFLPIVEDWRDVFPQQQREGVFLDRKSTRLNSGHQIISYAVFCLKKKNQPAQPPLRAVSPVRLPLAPAAPPPPHRRHARGHTRGTVPHQQCPAGPAHAALQRPPPH